MYKRQDLDIQVQKLRLLKSSFLSEKYALEDKIIKFYPQEIARRADVIAGLKSDIERVAEHPKPSDETFVGMTVKGAFYSEKAEMCIRDRRSPSMCRTCRKVLWSVSDRRQKEKSQRMLPVSYTHLDVYKRQGRSKNSAPFLYHKEVRNEPSQKD